jgi:hypothetical protein
MDDDCDYCPSEPFFSSPSVPEVTGDRLRPTGLLAPDGSAIYFRNPLGFTDNGGFVILKE